MSEVCPVCGQKAVGRKAGKRVKKWLQDSRLDRFMFDKLMGIVWARMKQEQAEKQLVEAAEKLPVEKRTDAEGRPLPRKALVEQRHRRMDTLRESSPWGWAGMFGGTDIVQPVKVDKQALRLSKEAMLKADLNKAKQREYSRAYYQKHKDAMNERRKRNREKQLARSNGQS